MLPFTASAWAADGVATLPSSENGDPVTVMPGAFTVRVVVTAPLPGGSTWGLAESVAVTGRPTTRVPVPVPPGSGWPVDGSVTVTASV